MRKFRENIEMAINKFEKIADIEEYLKYQDAIEIIAGSKSHVDAVESSYMFGYITAISVGIPIYDIPQISDERWNELTKTNNVSVAI